MAASIRSLAAHCGVSTATVSRALAGHASVLPATRRAVEAAARKLGYERNRLVGSMMAHLRVARSDAFVGNLAVVHVPGPGQTQPGPQQARIIRGAQARARELGYQLDLFSLGGAGMRLAAVVRMLRARGVLGVIFVHSRPGEAPLEFPWEEFVVLELDYGELAPTLHTVCHDHFASLTTALGRLRAMGYARAGLFIEEFKDARTGFRWSAAFRAFQERHGGIGAVPVLAVEAMGEAAFAAWYREHRPDVVIGHVDACVGWLEKRRRCVPADVGFFNLNWEARHFPCAGIDPRLELQGAVAAETLVAQVQRGELGRPAVPRTVLVPGRWVEGPTVRMAET